MGHPADQWGWPSEWWECLSRRWRPVTRKQMQKPLDTCVFFLFEMSTAVFVGRVGEFVGSKSFRPLHPFGGVFRSGDGEIGTPPPAAPPARPRPPATPARRPSVRRARAAAAPGPSPPRVAPSVSCPGRPGACNPPFAVFPGGGGERQTLPSCVPRGACDTTCISHETQVGPPCELVARNEGPPTFRYE